ncbi:hypothetical protein C7B67_23575 [filamentous cyanobacterium Phorm 6]|nr:hypothetical protein C7B67_23575 [filamentous cyanobacterium Phorm 6]
MTTITPEKIALISIYREKWREIGLSTQPIDRPQVTAAIHTAYNIIDFPTPEIIFCDRPRQLHFDLSEYETHSRFASAATCAILFEGFANGE